MPKIIENSINQAVLNGYNEIADIISTYKINENAE